MALFQKTYTSDQLRQKHEEFDKRTAQLEAEMNALRPKITEAETEEALGEASNGAVKKLRAEWSDLRDQLERRPAARDLIEDELADVEANESKAEAEKHRKKLEGEASDLEKKLQALKKAVSQLIGAIVDYRRAALSTSSDLHVNTRGTSTNTRRSYLNFALKKLADGLQLAFPEHLAQTDPSEFEADRKRSLEKDVHEELDAIPEIMRANANTRTEDRIERAKRRATERKVSA